MTKDLLNIMTNFEKRLQELEVLSGKNPGYSLVGPLEDFHAGVERNDNRQG